MTRTPDLVTVEDFLQKLRGFRLDLELAVRQRGVDEAVADDFAPWRLPRRF